MRARPSRRGSSPNRASISRISGAMVCSCGFGLITFTTALFDFIGSHLKDVARGLFDADLLQLRPVARKHFFPMLLQSAADLEPKILRGGHYPREHRHFDVQIAMVEGLDHLPVHQFIQLFNVHGAPAGGIDRPAHAYVDRVIVAVSVRIIALAINSRFWASLNCPECSRWEA